LLLALTGTSLQVIVDPQHVSVSNSFFLGMGAVVLKSKKGTIDGLVMTANSWNNANMPGELAAAAAVLLFLTALLCSRHS
jgi:hypothetical protein